MSRWGHDVIRHKYHPWQTQIKWLRSDETHGKRLFIKLFHHHKECKVTIETNILGKFPEAEREAFIRNQLAFHAEIVWGKVLPVFSLVKAQL